MAPEIKPLNWRRHSRDVIEFQREIYETNFPDFIADRQFLRSYGDQMRQCMNNPGEGLFVLEQQRRARGFLWVSLVSTMVEPRIGYIKNVYVAPELRGQGQAKRLLMFAEAWCLQRGVRRLTLDASCCNQRAMDVYGSAGFRTVRLRMEKTLEPADLDGIADELALPALASGPDRTW